MFSCNAVGIGQSKTMLFRPLRQVAAPVDVGMLRHLGRSLPSSTASFLKRGLLVGLRAFVINRLDYCNSMLYGVIDELL